VDFISAFVAHLSSVLKAKSPNGEPATVAQGGKAAVQDGKWQIHVVRARMSEGNWDAEPGGVIKTHDLVSSRKAVAQLAL
jgi:hypothetical protein